VSVLDGCSFYFWKKEKKMVRKSFSLFSLLLVVSMLLAACSGGGAATTAPQAGAATQPAAGGTATKLVFWDYYTSGDGAKAWAELVQACGTEAGVSIERQAVPRNEFISKVLLAAQQKQMPDVLMVDNPDLQEVANTGALAPLTEYGVNLDGLFKNLLEAGSLNGKVYGIAPGINGMALWYNKDMFDKAGVKPPTNWAEVEDAAAKLTKDGVYGIAFSAPATEEGTWQFEPWFWGAGGDLKKVNSPEGVQALQFWTDLVQKGYASKSVVQWSQGDVNDQFLAGKAAMQQNGVWNLNSIEKSGLKFGIVPIPAPKGGAAPGPMGGEVLTIPLTSNAANMNAAGKVVNCLLSDKNMLAWANLNSYIPARESLAQQVAKERPNMAPFVEAAAAERSRPGPPANLGPNYSKVSQPVWNAIQAALTGAKTPQAALDEAQKQAEDAMK
jgi:multiple sugar transport system substrate-binding protein